MACIGSFTYGYVISVLATTLSKPSFFQYMGLDTTGPGKGFANSIIATWNCLLYVGAVFGCILYSLVSNRWGRKPPMSLGSLFVVVGGALQAGCVDIAMLAVARVIIGLGIGMLLPAIPLYQAEISPPHARGLMVGLHGKTSIQKPMAVTRFNGHRLCARLRQHACSVDGMCFLRFRRSNFVAGSNGDSMCLSAATVFPHVCHARKSQMA